MLLSVQDLMVSLSLICDLRNLVNVLKSVRNSRCDVLDSCSHEPSAQLAELSLGDNWHVPMTHKIHASASSAEWKVQLLWIDSRSLTRQLLT